MTEKLFIQNKKKYFELTKMLTYHICLKYKVVIDRFLSQRVTVKTTFRATSFMPSSDILLLTILCIIQLQILLYASRN